MQQLKFKKERIFAHENARLAAEKTICISGSTRSGTTLMGTILHSCQNVEYIFEPPIILPILLNISFVPEECTRLLFESYIFEDLLLGQLAGRNVNLNENDDSCFYKAKTKKELAKRHSQSWRKNKMADCAKEIHPAFKMPEITPYLKDLQELYPSMEFVLMHRKANSVINSLMKKRWLSERNVSSLNFLWPCKIIENQTVPYWVSDQDIGYWAEWTELERAAYYYLQFVRPIEHLENAIVISYEKLIEKPREIIDAMISKLKLNAGEKTQSIVDGISEKTIPEKDWLSLLAPSLRKPVIELSERYTSDVL